MGYIDLARIGKTLFCGCFPKNHKGNYQSRTFGRGACASQVQNPCPLFRLCRGADDPATWKLPYRLADGSVDIKRLPKAIQAILSNYRGAKVSGVPEADIPDILVRLGQAATCLGKMPNQSGETAIVYQQLADVLEQLGRLDEVRGD